MNPTALLVNQALIATPNAASIFRVYAHLVFSGRSWTAAELATDMGVHVRTVYKALRVLAVLGVITRTGALSEIRTELPPHVANLLRALAAGTREFSVETECLVGSELAPTEPTEQLVLPPLNRETLSIQPCANFPQPAATSAEREFAPATGASSLPPTRTDSRPLAPAVSSRAHVVVDLFANTVADAVAIANAQPLAIANTKSIAKANKEHAPAREALSVSKAFGHRGAGLSSQMQPQTQLSFADLADSQLAIQSVFECWQSARVNGTQPHLRQSLTNPRRSCIAKRLAEGFSVGQLCQVIGWAATDPWMSGTDPRSTRSYFDISNLFGSGDKVAKYLFQADRRATGRLASNMLPAADGAWAPATRE